MNGKGSAALVAAVPYPGKASPISRKGQWSAKQKVETNARAEAPQNNGTVGEFTQLA